jgi:hypothetical protein
LERLIAVVVLVAVAVAFALILRRLTGPSKPASAKSWTVPVQLHHADFPIGQTPVLVVLFSSATCTGCEDVWERLEQLATDDVAVENVSWQEQRAIHERYGVDAVPTTVVVDREGVVRESFVGTVSTLELRAAIRATRDA